jgi:PAS domain S-box-containing protein
MHSDDPGIVADPLLNLLDEAFAETTETGILLRFNRRLLELLPDLRGNLLDVLPATFVSQIRRTDSPARETLTAELDMPTGARIRISRTPITSPGKNTFGWTLKDVTAVREKERELRLQVEQLDVALQGAGLGFWDWNLITNDVTYDARWCEMLGLDPASTAMRIETWDSLVHPDDRARSSEEVHAHIEGRTRQYENIHRLKHATRGWAWILASGKITERDHSGKPTRFSGVHLDVTAQKLAEQELHSSRELLDIATSTFKVGVWEWIVESKSLRWHPSMLPLFGYSTDAPENLEEIYRNCVSPADQEIIARNFAPATQGLGNFQVEYPILRKDGSARILLSKGFLQKDNSGKPVRMIGLNWDITEERNRQQELEHERMINLHASRMATLGEMAGGIAHEINSPLAVITMRAAQLRDYLSSKDPEPSMVRLLTETLESTALRIGRIVLAMKNLSRDSSRDSMATTRAADILNDVALIVQERFRLHSIGLQIRIEPQDLSLFCQPTEISQAILNLLQNARDAVENAPEKWIHIDVRESGGMAIFEITDSGAGISEQHRAGLFRPFFTTKPPGRGTGLGLGICRQIAEKHGGSIEYVRDSAHTCFRLNLPQRAPEARA